MVEELKTIWLSKQRNHSNLQLQNSFKQNPPLESNTFKNITKLKKNAENIETWLIC